MYIEHAHSEISGRGLKSLANKHPLTFKHPFFCYWPNKHRCLKTGVYGIMLLKILVDEYLRL